MQPNATVQTLPELDNGRQSKIKHTPGQVADSLTKKHIQDKTFSQRV